MNVYLLETTSRVLLEEQIDKILKGSNNKIIYNAEDCTIENILEEASYVSMFEEMKYLVVKNATFFGKGKLKEEEEEKLLTYLESPYPLCTILFTTYEPVDQRKKITKKIKENYEYQNIVTPKGLELYNKVASLLVEKKYLAENNITGIVHYPIPLNKQPVLGIKEKFEIAERISAEELSLPCSSGHTESEILNVIDIINDFKNIL